MLKTFTEIYLDKLTWHKDKGFKKSGEDTDGAMIGSAMLCLAQGQAGLHVT